MCDSSVSLTIGFISLNLGQLQSNTSAAGAAGFDPNLKARLDTLGRFVESYFHNGLAPSTIQAYDFAKHKYFHFGVRTNTSPLPLNENLLCRYVTYLADDGLSPRKSISYSTFADSNESLRPTNWQYGPLRTNDEGAKRKNRPTGRSTSLLCQVYC